MKKHLHSFLFALFVIATGTSYGQLYNYTSDTSGMYNSIAANTTAVKLTRFNGATKPGAPCLTGFSNTSFGSTTTYTTSLPAIEAQITPNAGYQLFVSGFSVDLRRSGTGPANVRLAYSTDGGFSWIDRGSDDAPNNASCGTTTTASWTTGFTVSGVLPLQFRVYGFNAGSTSGTLQILNLVINGTVTSSYSISTSAASFGPFCQNTNAPISVPYTTTGVFTGQFFVQLSDAAGVFPNDATSNIISTGTTTSPAAATIPSGTPAGTGYRVRVVNQSPQYYTSGDNGSNIIINPTVVPTVTITNSPATVCQGSPVSFSINTSANTGASPTYQWYVNNGATGTGATYSNSSLSNNDSVYLRLTSNALCASPTTALSNVIHMTVYSPQTTAIYDTLCPGDSIVFGGNTYTTTGTHTDHQNTIHGCDSAITLHLFVRDTRRDTLRTGICQGDSYTFHGTAYASAGTYSDTLSCDSIATLVLSYKTTQRTTVTAGICQGESFPFNGTTYNANGTYIDTVRCDSIVTLTLTVHPRPTAVATLTGIDHLSTTAYTTYQWLLNDAPVSGATSQNYTATQNGNYSVIVSDANGCTDTSNIAAVTVLALTEANTLHARIYPSPTSGVLNIDAEGLNSIEVIDVLGRSIAATGVNKGSTHSQLDISGFADGIYTLILRGSDNAVTVRTIAKQ